jgi:hypothetical protein
MKYLSDPQRILLGFFCLALDAVLAVGIWQSTLPFGIFTTIACGVLFTVIALFAWFGE